MKVCTLQSGRLNPKFDCDLTICSCLILFGVICFCSINKINLVVSISALHRRLWFGEDALSAIDHFYLLLLIELLLNSFTFAGRTGYV